MQTIIIFSETYAFRNQSSYMVSKVLIQLVKNILEYNQTLATQNEYFQCMEIYNH